MTIHVQTKQDVQEKFKAPTLPALTQSERVVLSSPEALEKGILGLRNGVSRGFGKGIQMVSGGTQGYPHMGIQKVSWWYPDVSS